MSDDRSIISEETRVSANEISFDNGKTQDVKIPDSNAKNDSLIEHDKNPDLILDFSAVNYVDTNGAKIVQMIVEDFKKINVFVYICQCQGMGSIIFKY